ncbi:hypothetical protein [Granulicella tundricola]|uniref:Uncharacterized protein n=1 Tax=Granulicella tundricola (strain ATCC BAA-1859 / DSM 23138 / MP5ACTX9) TaxID=1198114 RepID=E8X0P7_GRATM|nr:hypothetical protein [Granulicella tundricola]ADW68998.1 hypothetical protein AciX9_1952 [Granulicella tundricola MP5ACTX9]
MTNTSAIVETFLTQMGEQATVLVNRIAELDTEKATLQGELTKINHALAVWNGKETPDGKSAPGTRKKMSEAGRANIAAALQARSARLRAEKEAAGGKDAEAVAVPSAAEEKQSEPVQEATPTPKSTPAKKAAAKGGKADA